MLDEYKQSCKEAADILPNWKDLSTNDLCRLCIANEDNPVLYNAYFAAIQYKYWGLIAKYYNSCNGLVEPEVCRDWLIDTIMYALKHRRWEDVDSTLYNDPMGPDRAINTKMKCLKINQYQYSNRKKRKDEFGTMSLEALAEKMNDNTFGLIDNSSELDKQSIDINEYIKKLFLKKDYFMAYMLDGIINVDVFDDEDGTKNILSVKKLSRFLRNLTQDYCEEFAERYGVDRDIAIHSLIYFQKLNIRRVNSKIEYNIHKLRHDDFILGLMGGGAK